MRYKVLVVDDEENQRRALIDKVDWAGAGFVVIGEAENGVEGIEQCEKLEPDLVLTDIKMPMISGLELAAKIREMRPATQIVILSGYDSFEYARTAINYNIISYLLKPISSEELSEELKNIKKKMDERLNKILEINKDFDRDVRRLAVSEFLLPLMLGSFEHQPEEDELFEKAKELKIVNPDKKNYFCVLISKFKGSDGSNTTSKKHISFINKILSYYIKCESFYAYGRIVTLIISDNPDLTKILELPLKEIVQSSKRLLDENCSIGVSREFFHLYQCSGAYFQAVTARRYTSDGAGEIRFINDQEQDTTFEFDTVEKSVLKLEQLLKVGDKKDISDFLNKIYENNTPRNADLLVIQLIATVYRTVSSVSDDEAIKNLTSKNPIFSRLTSFSSEDKMKSELLDFCESAKEIISSSQKKDTEVLCDKVIHIINQNYSDEDLSLSGVSYELSVSPNYLSALIKKETKKNFVTLVTEKRMKVAYDLLLCSNMKILEIAEKCGYTDQHYFSYCFKKFYGESPNKIRSDKRA